MAANDELTRLRAKNEVLEAKAARLRAETGELREQLSAKMELNHFLRVKAARNEVQAKLAGLVEANAQLVEAIRNKEREEDALQDFLASRARKEDPLAHYKSARAEERSKDSAAPETKTKRKRASD